MSKTSLDLRYALPAWPPADLRHLPIDVEPAARLLGEHCEGVVPIYVDTYTRRVRCLPARSLRQNMPRKAEEAQ